MREVRRIANAVAESGMFLDAHVEMETPIDAYLAEFEAYQTRSEPINGLRWAFSHLGPGERRELERMSACAWSRGCTAGRSSRARSCNKVHGARAWDMPPFRRVQDSSSLGTRSDATRRDAFNPFLHPLVRR